jgi:hypothetical protein
MLVKVHYSTQMLKDVPRESYLAGRVVSKAPKKNQIFIITRFKCYNHIFLPWALAFFYHTTSFASLTAKPIGPCQWIM